MCLFKPQRVNNPDGIIAYKIVKRPRKDRNFFYGVVTDVPYEVGMSYMSLINRYKDIRGRTLIEEAIHLFTDLETARKAVSSYRRFLRRDKIDCMSIIKCYIPKSALVFKGEDFYENPAYAASNIRMLEVVEEYEIVQK